MKSWQEAFENYGSKFNIDEKQKYDITTKRFAAIVYLISLTKFKTVVQSHH